MGRHRGLWAHSSKPVLAMLGSAGPTPQSEGLLTPEIPPWFSVVGRAAPWSARTVGLVQDANAEKTEGRSPPDSLNLPYDRWKWAKDYDLGAGTIERGKAAEWFGRPGGATQFKTEKDRERALRGGVSRRRGRNGMQMNRHQLLAALREAGVPDRWYGINTPDLRSFEFVPESVPVLTQALDGLWYIEYFERGEQRDLAVLDAEDEACAYLYDRVMSHWNHYQSR